MELQNQIKKYRTTMKMSQEELSEKSGVNRTTISAIETGKAENIMTGTLVALAKALETTVDKIFYPEC